MTGPHNLKIKINNQGVALYQQRKYPQALKLYRQALKIDPAYSEAHFNLAVLYLVTTKYPKAITHFSQALKLNPHYAEAQTGLLQALVHQTKSYQQQGNYLKALATINRAISLSPSRPHLLYNQGIIYEQLGQLNQAITAYTQVINLDPHFYPAYPQLYMAKRKAFDWSKMGKLIHTLDHYHANTPFVSLIRTENLQKNLDAAVTCSLIYNQNAKLKYPPSSINHHSSTIKLGYFSKDFHDHPIGQLVAPLFKYHDRSRFEIYAFSYGDNDQSLYRRQIKGTVDHFIDIAALDNYQTVQLMINKHIDILIDLTGNTAQNRYIVLAGRPAPVQISWLGLLGTSGTNFIDYQMVDPIVVPLPHAQHYTEKLVHLPHVLPLYPPNKGKPLSRRQFDLPQNSFVFACFNQTYKITPELFSVWMHILKAISNSILWLWDREEDASHNLQQATRTAGIDPKRLIFFSRLPLNDHLIRAQCADLALDTTIYSGGATTAQTLSAGIPTLTLLGNHYASRLTASLLTQAGVPELITHSLTEYQSQAITLAKYPQKVLAIKSKIQNLKSNIPQFVTHLESTYKITWDRYRRGLPPTHLTITPQS